MGKDTYSLSDDQIKKIRQLVDDKYISVSKHPEVNLFIYNYTPKAQYDENWTLETLMCRGLILDDQGKIIARPFPKFFNSSEYSEKFGTLPYEPFEVYEKLDGSLGILYHYRGKPAIATRGRFDSYQAQAANKILQSKYRHIKFNLGFTYLFEIILPENRIVVDYGSRRDLFLLAIIETATGRDISISEGLDMPKVKKYTGIARVQDLQKIEEKNKEGFVVVFKSGLRLKVKFGEYIHLHKLVTGMSPKHIWEYLKEGKDLGVLLEKVPDEFYRWVKKEAGEIHSRFTEIENISRKEFKSYATRKETALYFKKCTYPAILFSLLDRKDYAQIIWKMVKPKSSGTFREDL